MSEKHLELRYWELKFLKLLRQAKREAAKEDREKESGEHSSS